MVLPPSQAGNARPTIASRVLSFFCELADWHDSNPLSLRGEGWGEGDYPDSNQNAIALRRTLSLTANSAQTYNLDASSQCPHGDLMNESGIASQIESLQSKALGEPGLDLQPRGSRRVAASHFWADAVS